MTSIDLHRVLNDAAEPGEREDLIRAWEAAGDAEFPDRMDASRTEDIRQTLRRRASGSRRVVWTRAVAIAASLVLALGVWSIRPTHYIAAPGKIAQIELRDGSNVELATGSSLTTGWRFFGGRGVALEGEAWFDVRHDPNNPFDVRTSDARIRVLGTRFSVRAWDNSRRPGTTVFLEQGIIELEPLADPAARAILEPGQSRQVSGSMLTDAPSYDQAAVGAWRRQDLLFRSEPLAFVLEDVARQYGEQVRFESGVIPDRRVSGAFRGRNGEEVVSSLALYLGMQYRRTSNGFLLIDPD